MKSKYKVMEFHQIIGLIQRAPQSGKNKYRLVSVCTYMILLLMCLNGCSTVSAIMKNKTTYYDMTEVETPPIFLPEGGRESNDCHISSDESYLKFIVKTFEPLSKENIATEDFVYRIDVEFIINKKGQLIDPKFTNIENSKLSDFQKKILKCLSIPQKWSPGIINGKPVNTKMRLIFNISPNT